MTTTTELRAALLNLAERAPTIDDLDHSAWAEAGPADQTRRQRPSGRTVLAVLAAAAAVVALVAIAVNITDGRTNSSPPASGGGVLEVRPLIAPAVLITSAGTVRSADPLRALAFTVPASENDYDALSATQQHQLLTALANTDCDAQSASAAPTRVACSPDLGGGQRIGYLLGPSIFGAAQLTDARAVPPSLPGGSTEWTVALTLNDGATAAWASYTRNHHVGSTTADGPTQCASAGTPCSDYVAFVIDGAAQSVPLTLATLGRSTQITGDFTERTATRIARELRP